MYMYHMYIYIDIVYIYVYKYIYIYIYIYIYTYNHPKVDRTWDFQPTFPFLLPGVMTWERPASHPPGGTPGWNALWSLRPTSRCG